MHVRQTYEVMKKIFIYLFAAVVVLMGSSCSDDDSSSVELTPYAALRAFSIGNLKAYYNVKTASGRDSVIVKTVVSSNYPFVIDQKTYQVYNPDSLPYGTDITKVATGVESDGMAFYYDEAMEYVPYMADDSIDFTNDARLLITSLDGENAREYSIHLNVHKVNPDSMAWNAIEPPVLYAPERALIIDERGYVFGEQENGERVLATFATATPSEIEYITVTGLPSDAEMGNVQNFGGLFYLVADNSLFVSSDGAVWSKSSAEGRFDAVIAASKDSERMWVAVDGNLAYTADGVSFTITEELPEGFPLYNISSMEYPLSTNMGILRSVIVGCNASDVVQPAVWSILSTEKKWVEYKNNKEEYACPAIADIAVFRYDGALYAIGGAGNVAGKAVEAFSVVYKSTNNGLTWLPSDANSVSLPASLKGYEAPFAMVADEQNRIWLFVGGDDAAAWCGRINRLGF